MFRPRLEGFGSRRLHATRSPLSCHPERSEGSAFLSCFSFSLRHRHSLSSPLTSVNSVPPVPVEVLKSPRPPATHRSRPSTASLESSRGPFGSSSFNFKLSTINLLRLSPFPATLTGHPQPAQNTTTLSPAVTTLTGSVNHNPFVCHSYRNTRGGGLPSAVSWHRLQCVLFRDALPRRGQQRRLRRNGKVSPSVQSPVTNHRSRLRLPFFHRSRVTSHESLSLLESTLTGNGGGAPRDICARSLLTIPYSLLTIRQLLTVDRNAAPSSSGCKLCRTWGKSAASVVTVKTPTDDPLRA